MQQNVVKLDTFRAAFDLTSDWSAAWKVTSANANPNPIPTRTPTLA